MATESVNRREFLGLTAAGIAGGVLGLNTSLPAGVEPDAWNPEKPLICTGRALVVQPVLMYQVAQKRPAASWKSWGGVQSDQAAADEAQRIAEELQTLRSKAEFPFEIRPVIKVKSTAEAGKVHENDYDVVIVCAASGSGDLLKACFTPKSGRDTLVFVRRSSGPAYYWFEALSTRYLQCEGDACVAPTGGLAHIDRPVHVDDVVVDDGGELLWRLRAALRNEEFPRDADRRAGRPWGKYSPEAPDVARQKYGMQIIDVSYEAVTPRIKAALEDRERMAAAERWTEAYLAMPGTTLATTNQFVVNAFMLYGVFKDLMREHNASAFTIRNCMSTIMPISQTTPCLTLGLLNDEGLMAFCESDFVIIPAGILLHHISGKPVFLHNSTFPHAGVVTCAHCIAPRRLDGVHYEPARIMTHYESEFGAATKVEIPIGRQVTFIDPQYSTGRWLGFTGIVRSNPGYEICRSQHDVEIQGNWRKLLNEVRDSHWMMAYGDHLKELAYAARKLGIQWDDLSQA